MFTVCFLWKQILIKSIVLIRNSNGVEIIGIRKNIRQHSKQYLRHNYRLQVNRFVATEFHRGKPGKSAAAVSIQSKTKPDLTSTHVCARTHAHTHKQNFHHVWTELAGVERKPPPLNYGRALENEDSQKTVYHYGGGENNRNSNREDELTRPTSDIKGSQVVHLHAKIKEVSRGIT